MVFPMPASLSTGRMIFFSTMSGDKGLSPFNLSEAKMKSVSFAYRVAFRHRTGDNIAQIMLAGDNAADRDETRTRDVKPERSRPQAPQRRCQGSRRRRWLTGRESGLR